MSSGRLTRVARPAQYTDARVDTPTAPSASAKRMVVPTGTSSPRAAQDAGEADREPVDVERRSTSGTALRSTVLAARSDDVRTSCSIPAARVRSWSSRYLRTVPRVTSTARSSMVVRPSAARALAQSMVSATPGGL